MAKHNTLQEVKNQMKEMLDKRSSEFNEIMQKQAEAKGRFEASEKAQKAASEIMDLDAYEAATAAMNKANAAIEMYSKRYDQLTKLEYISEAESDSVIDSLLDYEKKLSEDFRKAISKPIDALSEILREYRSAIRDVEETLTAWQRDIHHNYRSFSRTQIIDKTTGRWTDRMNTPIPVHMLPYEGCSEAYKLGEYLNDTAFLLKNNKDSVVDKSEEN